jgi:hypothetical protein
MVLRPGEQRQIRFDYELPVSVVESRGTYRLYIQKQSGTLAIPIRVRVRLPWETSVLSSESNLGKPSVADVVAYDSDLTVDRYLKLALQFPMIGVESLISNWTWMWIPTLGLILIVVGLYLRRTAHPPGR